MIEKYEDYPLHDSQRGWFGRELYFVMKENPKVYCLTGDLGWGLLDNHFRDFPERCVNCGAAEQLLLGISCGLALDGKIPFAYSISPFLIFRPYEWIRNYVNHERIPVRLVGSGLDDDYKHDGITHHAFDVPAVLDGFENIRCSYPLAKESVSGIVRTMVSNAVPHFLALRR